MRIIVTWDATTAERAVLAGSGLEVGYLEDGDAPRPGDGVLTFWPKRELKASGLSWADLKDVAWVKVATAGVNHIGWRDVPQGLQVMSTPGSTGGFIAEYVHGAIIAWARGFQRHTHEIRTGGFEMGAPARSLSELHIGLVGFGGIGQAVASALQGSGATVSAVSRSGQSPAAGSLAGLETMDGLPDLAQASDVLVVCLPLTVDTVGLIDRDILQRLGPRGLLVNVARGHVVKEQHLYDWLKAEPGAHAHLDVWWQYPKHEGHPFSEPFHDLANLTMTPHNSPNVTGHRIAMLERALQDIRHQLQTGEALHVEDRDAYRMDVEGDGR